MNVDEIVNANKENTTLDAYNNACRCIREEIHALNYTADLLFEVGSEKMAKRIQFAIRELEFSIATIEKYVSETHNLMYLRANESSNNLFQLGMGLSEIIRN